MLDKGKIALIGVGGGGLLIFLVVALCYLYVKNRKIYKEYRCAEFISNFLISSFLLSSRPFEPAQKSGAQRRE